MGSGQAGSCGRGHTAIASASRAMRRPLIAALLASSVAALTPRAPAPLNTTESALADAWARDLLRGHLERPDGRHQITLCAVATALETRFIDEWILTHALLGVGRFIIYDTSFTTELHAALQRWMDAGLVTLVHPSFAACVGRHAWTRLTERSSGLEWQFAQQSVLRHCVDTYGGSTDWLGSCVTAQPVSRLILADGTSTSSSACTVCVACPTGQRRIDSGDTSIRCRASSASIGSKRPRRSPSRGRHSATGAREMRSTGSCRGRRSGRRAT